MMPIITGLMTSKSVDYKRNLEKKCSLRKYCKIYFSHLNLHNESLKATNQTRSGVRQSGVGSLYDGASEPQDSYQSPGGLFDIELALDENVGETPQLLADTSEGFYSWCSPVQMEYLCSDSSGFNCFESNL